jgi:hypothetical protein
MRVLENGQIRQDLWSLVEGAAALPPGPVIVDLDRLLAVSMGNFNPERY